MPKILPVAILIAVLAMLSQFARTSTDGYRQTEAAELLTSDQENHFKLKQSYPIGSEIHNLLATIYSCGTGAKQKEILSIWSRESDAYELQYIRTAAAGQTFKKPEIFSNEKMSFIKISTEDRNTGRAAIDTVLRVDSDSTLKEAPTLAKAPRPKR